MIEDFLDEDGKLLIEPAEPKTQADLDRVISLGKPKHVIDKFAELVTKSNNLEYIYDYVYYLNAKYDFDLNGEGDEPQEPVKPEEIKVDPVSLRSYPSIEEQLDYIYHNGLTKWKSNMIKPVKDAHPKY
ncbi:MAG: hypothetical protein GY941_26250 [Planctomycetes bacterium]|nr:hypothetical protein [Planctomycetota bacterium]